MTDSQCMGVEWDIGCERCRRYIWLGSQKPNRWLGFQVGDEVVRRFLGLHPAASGCQLRLTNDGTSNVAWEDGVASGWREDILSRTFWDSSRVDGLVCGHCEAPRPELRKNQYLWFCGESCFDGYQTYQAAERDRPIYDSTADALAVADTSELAVACLDCQEFLIVDGSQVEPKVVRDIHYLALFLCEHIGEHRLLAVHIAPGGDDPRCPWHGLQATAWRPYVY